MKKRMEGIIAKLEAVINETETICQYAKELKETLTHAKDIEDEKEMFQAVDSCMDDVTDLDMGVNVFLAKYEGAFYEDITESHEQLSEVVWEDERRMMETILKHKKKIDGEWIDSDFADIDWSTINDIIVKGKHRFIREQWIPVCERLPKEDEDVLITYRYKDGEGDTSHAYIEITSYGTVCFGGRQIHELKEWRQPFEFFHANYEVVAWMPLPKPYETWGQYELEGDR